MIQLTKSDYLILILTSFTLNLIVCKNCSFITSRSLSLHHPATVTKLSLTLSTPVISSHRLRQSWWKNFCRFIRRKLRITLIKRIQNNLFIFHIHLILSLSFQICFFLQHISFHLFSLFLLILIICQSIGPQKL
jgi:hypothetical protein